MLERFDGRRFCLWFCLAEVAFALFSPGCKDLDLSRGLTRSGSKDAYDADASAGLPPAEVRTLPTESTPKSANLSEVNVDVSGIGVTYDDEGRLKIASGAFPALVGKPEDVQGLEIVVWVVETASLSRVFHLPAKTTEFVLAGIRLASVYAQPDGRFTVNGLPPNLGSGKVLVLTFGGLHDLDMIHLNRGSDVVWSAVQGAYRSSNFLVLTHPRKPFPESKKAISQRVWTLGKAGESCVKTCGTSTPILTPSSATDVRRSSTVPTCEDLASSFGVVGAMGAVENPESFVGCGIHDLLSRVVSVTKSTDRVDIETPGIRPICGCPK